MTGKMRASKVRNVLHNHPLLRKGGVHRKSNKAIRRAAKQSLRSQENGNSYTE